MRDNKPKKIALIVLVVAVIGLTVAFATLSSNLTINGNAKLDPINWDIYFDNISGVDLSGEAAIVNNPEIDSNNKTKITNFNVTLNKPGDKVAFTVDLVNESDITAIIDKIDTPTINYDFIEFKAIYTGTNTEVKEGNVIAAKTGGEPSRTNITVSVYYSKEKVTNEDLEKIPVGGLTIDLKNYGLTFVQSDKTANMPTIEFVDGCTEFTKKDTYEVGDVISFCNKNKGYTNSDGKYVKGKSEDFYVISDNGDTVTALAKYNLIVGNKLVYDDSFENLLSKTALTSSDKDYGLQSGLTKAEIENTSLKIIVYGTIAFANKDENRKKAGCTGNGCYLGYWANTDGSLKDSYKNESQTDYPADVYDSNSILYEHVQKYQTYFTSTLKKATSKMRLITYNELVGLGCKKTTSDSGSCKTETVATNKREWIYTTNYWSASAYAYNDVWMVDSGGYFSSFNGFWNDDFMGARPVITISKSEI